MATSGTITKAIRTGYEIRIVWNADSQSVADNTSTVTSKVQLVSTGASYTINSTASKSGSITINGTQYNFTFTAALSGNQVKTLYTKTVTISHNADGSKTCAFACSCAINVTLSGTYYGTVSASGSGTFNTIARASSITSVTASVSVNGTNAVTIAIDRKSSSFTHTVDIKIGAKSKTQTGVATSYSYAIPVNWLEEIPNATSGTATVTVTTYSGTTKIGTATSKNFTITAPSNVIPSISSLTLSEAVSGLSAQFGGYVQGKSKVRAVTAAAGIHKSTITTVKVTIDGKSYTGADITSAVLTSSGTLAVSVTVTDSRGRTATKSQNITVFAYAAPQISTLTAARCNADGTENYEGVNGKIAAAFTVASVNNKNRNDYKIEYKLTSGTTWATIETGNSYAFNKTIVTGAIFGADSAFEIRVSVTDYFVTITKTVEIPTAFTLIDFNKSGRAVAFGKVSELAQGIEFALQTHFDHIPIIKGGSKILWQGAWYMTATHTAQLSEPVSDQVNGIVLVFSRYASGAAEDSNFNIFFVPKYFVNKFNGYGHAFIMSNNIFSAVATKYLYIYNNYITGHASNNATGTAASGITYSNNQFVLRFVIGI